MRKASETGLEIPSNIPVNIDINEKETGLLKLVHNYPALVEEAGTNYSPALIANYVYDLSKEFNQFYHDYSILKESNEEIKIFRLVLARLVGRIIKSSMGIMGIDVPERM